MKKLLFTIVMAILCTVNGYSQEIYNEVKALQKHEESIVNDTTKNIEVRKVACFKYDALYYLIDKAGNDETFTEYDLGMQANAMIDFVNLYVKRIGNEKKQRDKNLIMAKFKAATINHALFNDVDKEVVYAYVDNDKYITQFSLDTDWVKAFEEVRK